MYRKKAPKHKYTSLFLVSTLMLSLVAQSAVPLSVYANQEKEDVITTVEEKSSVLSIKETLDLPDNEKQATVSGYIVGYVLDDKEISRDPDDFTDVNFAIADDSEETDIENMIFVKLSEDFKEQYALSSNPEILNKKITITSTLEEYLDHAGLIDLTELELVTEEIEETEDIDEDSGIVSVDSIEEAEEIEETNEEDVLNIVDETEAIDKETEDIEEAENYNAELIETDLASEKMDEAFELSIMHMNDTHGKVENYPFMLSAIKDHRIDNPESLLLHGGDVFSGTLYFNEWLGQADLALMNLMDFDAMVFGNHEFDLGTEEYGHPELADFVNNANFPMLSTNIDFSKDPVMKDVETHDSIIVESDGEEIGIFGLTTEDTLDIASPINVKFLNYIDTAKAEVKKLEDAGIDKIVAVTHLGYDSAPAVGNDLVLAESVDGIDVIVGGHSHTAVESPTLVEKEDKAPTVIVQSGSDAENLGTLNVSFNEDGEIIDQSGELIDVKENYEADEDALKVLAPYKEQVDEMSTEEIGAVAQKDLVNPRLGDDSDVSVRANETELGNLVTDAMLAKSKEKEPDTVIALQNGGGIRNSIDKGPITVGEVISVLPFGNNPVVAELSGLEIKTILEHAVSNAPEENGGFLHVSGMNFSYDSEKEVGNRVVEMILLDDGKETEIDPEGNLTYKITTNGFTGQGGDGFDTFADAYAAGRVKDIGEIDWQQLVDYMAEEEYLGGVVDPQLEGRITDLKGEAIPEEPEDQTEGKKEAEVVDKLIDELPKVSELTLADKEQVDAARKAYNALSDEAKKLVTNLDDLVAREAKISDLEKGEPGVPGKPGADGKPGTDGENGEPSAGEPSKPDVNKPSEPGSGKPSTEKPGSQNEEGILPQTGEANNKGQVVIGLIAVSAGLIMLVGTYSRKKKIHSN